jgi:hypothetical protein
MKIGARGETIFFGWDGWPLFYGKYFASISTVLTGFPILKIRASHRAFSQTRGLIISLYRPS